jgi:SAM-dependent methyltransferase
LRREASMHNDIKAFYDATAESTADEWYPNDILKPSIDDFISLFPSNPRILDLGCGPGHESMRLAAAGAIVTGFDFSGECIRIANERCPGCTFEVKDIRYLNEEPGSFDGVFACASLIHIAPFELPAVISSIRSIIAENGYFNTFILDGSGISEEYSDMEVNGMKFKRTVYLYSKNLIIDEAKNFSFEFLREGFLDEELKKYGWRNYIFRAGSI